MISERALRQAAAEANQILLEQMPSKQECEHTFSPEFEQRMELLLKQTKRPGFYRSARKVAGILLPILLAASIFVTVVPDSRAVVFTWFKKVSESRVDYHSEVDNFDPEKVNFYEPTWIPKGYTVYNRYQDDSYLYISYIESPESEHLLLFICSFPIGSSNSAYIAEGPITHKEGVVQGNPADIILAEADANAVIWSDETTGALLSVSGYLPEEELMKIAQSVKMIS